MSNGTEPVNETTLGIGLDTSVPPTSASPYTTLRASLMAYFEFINIFANLYAVSGASGVGFNTTLLPAPSAGANLMCH